MKTIIQILFLLFLPSFLFGQVLEKQVVGKTTQILPSGGDPIWTVQCNFISQHGYVVGDIDTGMFYSAETWNNEVIKFKITNVVSNGGGNITLTLLNQGDDLLIFPSVGGTIYKETKNFNLSLYDANTTPDDKASIFNNNMILIDSALQLAEAGTSFFISDSLLTTNITHNDSMYIIGEGVKLEGNKYRINIKESLLDSLNTKIDTFYAYWLDSLPIDSINIIYIDSSGNNLYQGDNAITVNGDKISLGGPAGRDIYIYDTTGQQFYVASNFQYIFRQANFAISHYAGPAVPADSFPPFGQIQTYGQFNNVRGNQYVVIDVNYSNVPLTPQVLTDTNMTAHIYLHRTDTAQMGIPNGLKVAGDIPFIATDTVLTLDPTTGLLSRTVKGELVSGYSFYYISGSDTIEVTDKDTIVLPPAIVADSFYVNTGDSILFIQQGDTIPLPTLANTDTDSIFVDSLGVTLLKTRGDIITLIPDTQNLSLVGDSLLIERGTGVDLSVYRDTFIDTNTDTDSIYFNNGDTTILILRKDTITVTQDGNIDSFYVYFGADSVVYIQQGDTIFLSAPAPEPPPSIVNCNGPTEIVDVINPVTGRTWMDRNLGASQKATSSTDAAAYGDLYQWGRFGDGHQCRTSETTTTLATTAEPFTGGVWDSLFIIGSSNWLNTLNDNLWQGVNGVNNPCPTGYRLPTKTEWNEERLSWSNNNSVGAFESPLKLTLAGRKILSLGTVFSEGVIAYYWSSSVLGIGANYLNFSNDNSGVYLDSRSLGLSIRCIKEPSGFASTDTIINSFKAGYLYDADDTTAVKPIVIDNDIYFQLNEEAVEDVIGTALSNGDHTNIVITYNDNTGGFAFSAVDTSGRNQSLTITNDTLFLTDADTTLKVLLPQVVDKDTDTLWFKLGETYYRQTRNDTLNIPVAIDTSFSSNDTLFFVSSGDTTTVVLSVPGDKWGDQVVISDSTLSGKGTVAEPLTVNYLPDLVFDGDSSVTNELQNIDSVVLLDNLLTVYISDGASASVDLSGYSPTDRADTSGYNLTFEIVNDSLYITDANAQLSVDLSAYLDNTDTDSIIIDSLGTLLVKQRGDIITLIPDTDTNTDEQNLSLSGDSLLIERGTGVDLSVYRDTFIDTNTDGDTIYFDNRDSVRLIVRGDTIFLPEDLVFDGDSSITNELQDLSRVGDSIQITNGTGVYISDFFDNTDTSGYNQSLTFANGQLTITDGNNSLIVTIPDSVGGFPLPTDSITFNNNEAGPDEAELNWDSTLGYLVFGGLGDQLIQIGQDQYWMTVNQSGDLIEKGEVVMAVGATGNSGKFLIQKYLADGNTDPNYLLGVAAHDIPDGTEGYVMHQGKIRQIDLTAYTTGQVLYVSPTVAGDWVTTEPANGYQKLPIAFVVDNSDNGTLAVRVKTGEALRDLHDVDVSGVTDNQIIKYDAALGYWTLSADEDTQLTEEEVEDYVGGMLTGTQTGITVTYQDGTNDIDFVAADISPTNEIQGLTLTNDGDDRFTIGLSGNSNTVNLLEGNNVNLSYKDTLGGNSIVVDINQAFPYGRQGISVEDTNTVKLGFATKEDAILVNNAIGAVATAAPRFIDIEQVGLGTRLEFMQSPSTGYSSAYADSSFIRFSAHDFYLGQAAERASNVEFDWYYNSQVQSPQPPYDFSDYNLGYKTRLRQRVTWGDFATGPVNYKFEIDSDGDIRLTPGDDLELMNIPNDDTDVNVLTIDNNVVSYRAVSSLPDNNNYVNSITMSDGNNDDTWDITLGRVGLADVTTTVDLAKYLDNTDDQELSIASNILSIENGTTTINLTPYLDNTDNQDLSLSGNILSLTNDATTVDLTPYVNDPTNLSFSGASSPYTLNSSTGNDVTFAAGTGITLSESSNQLTITNASPDQVVNLTAGSNVSITGTYPSFTINSSFTDTDTDTRVNVFEGATSKTANTTKLTFDVNDFDVAASGTEATVSVNFPADNNTTYDLSAEAIATNPSIILTPSSGTADEVTLIGGPNVTIQSDGSNNITISSTDTDTQLTEEQVEDYVGGMLTGTQTGITVTYQDGTNDIDFVAADISPDNEIQNFTVNNSTNQVDWILDGNSAISAPNVRIKGGDNVTIDPATVLGVATINAENDIPVDGRWIDIGALSGSSYPVNFGYTDRNTALSNATTSDIYLANDGLTSLRIIKSSGQNADLVFENIENNLVAARSKILFRGNTNVNPTIKESWIESITQSLNIGPNLIYSAGSHYLQTTENGNPINDIAIINSDDTDGVPSHIEFESYEDSKNELVTDNAILTVNNSGKMSRLQGASENDGQVLKWNHTSGKFEFAEDLSTSTLISADLSPNQISFGNKLGGYQIIDLGSDPATFSIEIFDVIDGATYTLLIKDAQDTQITLDINGFNETWKYDDTETSLSGSGVGTFTCTQAGIMVTFVKTGTTVFSNIATP